MCVNFSNPFVIIFVAGTFLSLFINLILEFIDYKERVKNGGKIPEELSDIELAKDTFSGEKLENICKYENTKYFAWLPRSIITMLVDFALVIFGFYPWIFNLTTTLFGFPTGIGSSFLVFLVFSILSSLPGEILSIPFDLYREFIIEKKFGFSKMTFKLWITDQLKNLVLSLLLTGLLTIAASFFFVKAPNNWWWILAAILIGFTLIMQVIYPKFIAPLFNKFEPLPDGELKEKITGILEACGFKNDGLFVMDESKRSGHSNAYFTGFGKAKRIVLYDTLIKQMTADELTAVLGHELGHYKLHHITRRLFILIPLEFVLMFVLYKLAQLPSLYTAFGFKEITALTVTQVQFIGLFLAITIWGSISEILSPVMNIGSRRDEYAADKFSAKLCGSPDGLITGLVKLNSENLVELFPPKLYVFWNYSHPTLCQRVKALKELKNK